MTEEFVIDLQGFVGAFSQFIPKEIAILPLYRPYSEYWLVTAPSRFVDLPSSAKRQNNWLTRNYHRLVWEDGEVPYHALPLLLGKATTLASIVYVRGKEKARYLREILSTPVVDLENFAPLFRQISAERNYCIFHGSVVCELYTCALQNAHKLKHWIQTERERNNPALAYFSSNKILSSDVNVLQAITANELSEVDEESEADTEETLVEDEEEEEEDSAIDVCGL